MTEIATITSDTGANTAPVVPESWTLEPGRIADELAVATDTGLSSALAAERLAQYGPNELRAKPREPAWKRFLRQFADPLVYLLLVAIVISVFAWFAEGAHGVPVDAIVIIIIVVANAIIGFVQENRAEDAVAALANMTATRSTVLRDGQLTEVQSADIVPGDILVLSEGDAVGADARLFSAASLQVQEASLTGESEAAEKGTGQLDLETGIGDRDNMVFKGTAVARGVGRGIVVATGMGTEMGRIATLLDETDEGASPLQVEIAKISKALGALVIGIAVVVMVALAIINGVSSLNDAVEILLLGVSLAVAAVPEGLPAILSLVLAIGVQLLARQNAVMKRLHSAETLGSTSVICSDKTGTLTKNEMTLREVVTASGRVKFGGTGYEPVGEATVEGVEANVLPEARRVLGHGVLANNAQLRETDGRWQIQGDPTEAAFLVAEKKLDGVRARVDLYERRGEVPFSSERKMMSVLVDNATENITKLSAKGAPDVLLERCDREQVGTEIVPLTDERRAELTETVNQLNHEGYRTLAVAWREANEQGEVHEGWESNFVHAGIVGIIDPPREEAAAAIKQAHRAGIRAVMITGDHPVTAARIAADLGLASDGKALSGRELDQLDEDGWREAAQSTSVFARVTPEHKLKIVDALQSNRQIVAMTGDGVNDAPAVKAADIGIAMGITGTEVTKEASEMILGDDNYATIVTAVRQGRVIFDNIKKFMRYLLSSNMGEVATVFLGVVLASVVGLADPANPGVAVVPLLATQILWINLVTDSGPALAMGVDPEIEDVMGRPPRKYDDRIIDSHMWFRIITIGALMGILSLIVYDIMLPGGLINGLAHTVPVELQFATARTVVFTSMVMMQLFNAINSRSDMGSAFSHLFTNKWLWGSIALATIGQVLVVEVPFLQNAFGTVSLDPLHWAIGIGTGVVVLLFEEVVKLIRRSMAKSAAHS